MLNLYDVAQECKDYMLANITKRINKVHSGNLVFTDYDIIGDLKKWEDLLLNLQSASRRKYPSIASQLKEYIYKFDEEPIVYFSSIGAILDCLLALEENKCFGKRIFISHSSKDEACVTDFVNHILCLGIGVNREDIFCTSIEDLSIRNGEDIRSHIQENIRSAEYSFLLLSDNYKSSEICVNEMGAVWAYDSNVRLYLLPNTTFSSIGWLCDPRKANKLYDSVALDRLYNEMIIHFKLPSNIVRWSQQRETFLRRR